VDQAAVARTRELLDDPGQVKTMVEKNYAIAQDNFSLEVLERKVRAVLASC